MGRGTRGAAVLALVVLSVTGCAELGDAIDEATATSTSTSTSTTITTTSTTTAAAAATVDRLVVVIPDPATPTYVRARFGDDWDYDPVSGCNTRERVLIEEALEPPVLDDRCRSLSGRWRSVYDGVATTDPADLQIDHFIPLADAWRSGAWTWTDERREAFANDLDDPRTLVAVTGSTNQSKGDRGPDGWLPPDRASWCWYAEAWVGVKATWSLTVTPAEKSTLVQVLSGC